MSEPATHFGFTDIDPAEKADRVGQVFHRSPADTTS